MRKWLIKHNIGIWAVSFVAALALWWMTWVLNPQDEVLLTGIKVEILGEAEFLSDSGLCVIEGGEQTFDLTFLGRQTDLNRLNPENVKIRVDASSIVAKGEMNMAYDLVVPTEVENRVEVKWKPYSIRVVIDNIATKDVEVALKDSYDIAEGYVASDTVFQPSTILVTGPESVLRTIAFAEVVLVHTDIDTSIKDENLLYSLVDENGERVEWTELLTANTESVLVSLMVQKAKDVPLRLRFIDGGGLKASENVVCSIMPPSILISGPAEDLDELDTIYLDEIDLSRMEDEISTAMPIPLPDNLRNLNGAKEAEVTITFRGIGEKDVLATNIRIANEVLPEGCEIELYRDSLPVRIRGAEGIIGMVQPQDVMVIVDLANKPLRRGLYPVPAKVYIDSDYIDSVGVLGEYDVMINVFDAPPEDLP